MNFNVDDWEKRTKDLTSSVSLTPSCSNNYVSQTMVPSNAAAPAVNHLLGRFEEMEERQQRMEGYLIGGVGGNTSELEEIRRKRIVLEERQITLEDELLEWKRRLRSEICEPKPVVGKKGKQIVKETCKRCEAWKDEKKRVEILDQDVNKKIQQLDTEKACLESEKTWLESQKRDLEDNWLKYNIQLSEFDNLQQSSNGNQLGKEVCARCEKTTNVEKLQDTLCIKLNELAEELASVEGEKAWIDCVKRDLEESRKELIEQRKTIERDQVEIQGQKQVLAEEKQNIASRLSELNNTIAASNAKLAEKESIIKREQAVSQKTKELKAMKINLEKKEQELTVEQQQMEQQWEQLLNVQKTLDAQQKKLEREKIDRARMQSLSEWEKELSLEREKVVLEKENMRKENEKLNEKRLEVHANYNLLELQMQAISALEEERVRHRRTHVGTTENESISRENRSSLIFPRRLRRT